MHKAGEYSRMKHGKKPTVAQKKFIKESGLNPENWLISKNTAEEMVILHRHTENIKVLKN